MDWTDIFSIVIPALAAVGWLWALRSRKKGGPIKGEELSQHLFRIGVEASLPENGSNTEVMDQKRSRGQKSEGIIEVKDRNIDWISIIGVSSQYGTNYSLDWVVNSPGLAEKGAAETVKLEKIRLKKRKSSPLWGKAVGIEWKGNNPLTQSLRFNYRLEDRLLHSNIKGSIEIIPEPKWGHIRIRTTYFLPSPEIFEAIDIIARHIRSEYR